MIKVLNQIIFLTSTFFQNFIKYFLLQKFFKINFKILLHLFVNFQRICCWILCAPGSRSVCSGFPALISDFWPFPHGFPAASLPLGRTICKWRISWPFRCCCIGWWWSCDPLTMNGLLFCMTKKNCFSLFNLCFYYRFGASCSLCWWPSASWCHSSPSIICSRRTSDSIRTSAGMWHWIVGIPM